MATIRVKRGTTAPTTSNLTNVGELAFDYTNNHLYARGSSAVVKVGGELEKVYSYQGTAYYKSLVYSFNKDYIYKVHIIASTNGASVDGSDSYIYYRTSSQSNLYGSYISHHVNTVDTNHSKSSGTNAYRFYIEDSYLAGPTIVSGITKVIDFEISPTFKSSYNDVQQWVTFGKSITTLTDQNDAPIKMVDFAHSFNGVLGALYINPGLNVGSPDSISVTIYRTKRK